MIHPMMETRALTYIEISELFGVTVPSARNLASKRRWQRVISNDAKSVRVHVPIEAIPATPLVSPNEAPDGSLGASLTILAKHIETLQAELEVARADASQVPSLRASLDEARGDASRLGDEVTRLGDEASRLRESLNVEQMRATAAETNSTALQATIDELRSRTLWQRLRNRA